MRRSHGDGGIDQRGENVFRLRYLREIAKQLRESDAWQAALWAKKGNEQ